MYGLSLGGSQQWATPIGGSDDAFMQQQRQPATGADGSLYLTRNGRRERLGPSPRRPGQRQRAVELLPLALERDVALRASGRTAPVYFSRSLSFLESVTPNGQSRWTFFDGSIVDHPAVSPDGNIVVAGNRPNFG